MGETYCVYGVDLDDEEGYGDGGDDKADLASRRCHFDDAVVSV